jgi:hypothetical protein
MNLDDEILADILFEAWAREEERRRAQNHPFTSDSFFNLF